MMPPRAYTFIGLNIIRALSIIALILVFASNIVTLVHDIQGVNRFLQFQRDGSVQVDPITNSTLTDDMLDCDYIEGSTVPNQPAGIFWAVVNRLFIIGQAVVLILSEIGWPSSFFDRFFPVLGQEFGLGALGIIQCLIGAAILSHHVDDFTLVAAFFLFSVGCLNMFLGLIFRQGAKSKRSITSWREQTKNVLPAPVASGLDAMKSAAGGPIANMFTGNSNRESDRSATPVSNVSFPTATKGYGFGRQAEKSAALKGYLISKPVESLPKYSGGSSRGDDY